MCAVKSLAWIILVGLALSGGAAGAPQNELKTLLQDYLKGPLGGADKTTRFRTASAFLKHGSAEQTIVFVIGKQWCSARGCTLLVVSNNEVISKTIGVSPPVVVLPEISNGWHDLGIRSAEGAKRLTFNGWRYPINAYSFPAQRMSKDQAGKIAIPTSPDTAALY